MKLIMAIVNNDDSHVLETELMRAGFYTTKLATTGGFLKAGNTTFLIGTSEDKVQSAVDIIARHSKRRTSVVPSALTHGSDMLDVNDSTIEVAVGGATVFVLPVDAFEKF